MRSSELSVPEYDEVFRDDDEEVSSKMYLSFIRFKGVCLYASHSSSE
jgi:hypothetical protein